MREVKKEYVDIVFSNADHGSSAMHARATSPMLRGFHGNYAIVPECANVKHKDIVAFCLCAFCLTPDDRLRLPCQRQTGRECHPAPGVSLELATARARSIEALTYAGIHGFPRHRPSPSWAKPRFDSRQGRTQTTRSGLQPGCGSHHIHHSRRKTIALSIGQGPTSSFRTRSSPPKTIPSRLPSVPATDR